MCEHVGCSQAFGISGCDTIECALCALCEMMPECIVAITNGNKGVHAQRYSSKLSGMETWNVQAPKVKVIDTTGGGDAWNAGFLFHYVQNQKKYLVL